MCDRHNYDNLFWICGYSITAPDLLHVPLRLQRFHSFAAASAGRLANSFARPFALDQGGQWSNFKIDFRHQILTWPTFSFLNLYLLKDYSELNWRPGDPIMTKFVKLVTILWLNTVILCLWTWSSRSLLSLKAPHTRTGTPYVKKTLILNPGHKSVQYVFLTHKSPL